MSTAPTWSDLPVEMIAEVIKLLDFKSRLMMRGTARFEKAVVEATKMPIHYVNVSAEFHGGPYVYTGDADFTDEETFGGFEGEKEKVIGLVVSLIKCKRITQFQLSADSRHFLDGWIDFLEKVTEGAGKFKFTVFNVNNFNDNDFHRAFQLCEPGIEIISLYRIPKLGFERVFRDQLTLPVVLGASIIQLEDHQNPISWVKVIMEAWIKNDQIVGKKVINWIASYKDDDKGEYERDEEPRAEAMMEEFKSQFEERVVEETPKSIRIRMDSTEKHILMRIHSEEDDDSNIKGRTRVIALWEVIAADLTEEKYTKNSGCVYVEC